MIDVKHETEFNEYNFKNQFQVRIFNEIMIQAYGLSFLFVN